MESVARGQITGRESLIAQARIGVISAIAVGLISFLFLFLFGFSLTLHGAQSETFDLSKEYFI